MQSKWKQKQTTLQRKQWREAKRARNDVQLEVEAIITRLAEQRRRESLRRRCG